MTGEKKGIVTDADGTIWGFPEYFVPAMRLVVPMLAALFSQKLGRLVTWDEVSYELGRVMLERGTHEWPWVLEETKFWQDPEMRKVWNSYSEFLEKAVIPFWTTLDNSCRKNCVLMEEFAETATALRKKGKFIIIHSKGPFYSVRKKIWQLGVDKLITGAYAMELKEPEGLSDKELAYGRERVRMFSDLKLACPMEVMPLEHAKPDPRGLQKILKAMGAKPLEALMVGDSLIDDGGVAEAAGVPFLWARYGTHLPPDYVRTMIEHFNPPQLRKPKEKKFPPMVDERGAASWKEVLDHLELAPLSKKKTKLSESARPEPIAGLPS